MHLSPRHHDDVSVDAVMPVLGHGTSDDAPANNVGQSCYIHAVALIRIWLCVIYVFIFLYYVLFFLRLFLNTSPGTRQHRWILS